MLVAAHSGAAANGPAHGRAGGAYKSVASQLGASLVCALLSAALVARQGYWRGARRRGGLGRAESHV